MKNFNMLVLRKIMYPLMRSRVLTGSNNRFSVIHVCGRSGVKWMPTVRDKSWTISGGHKYRGVIPESIFGLETGCSTRMMTMMMMY